MQIIPIFLFIYLNMVEDTYTLIGCSSHESLSIHICSHRLIAGVCFILKCEIKHKTISSCSKEISTHNTCQKNSWLKTKSWIFGWHLQRLYNFSPKRQQIIGSYSLKTAEEPRMMHHHVRKPTEQTQPPFLAS